MIDTCPRCNTTLFLYWSSPDGFFKDCPECRKAGFKSKFIADLSSDISLWHFNPYGEGEDVSEGINDKHMEIANEIADQFLAYIEWKKRPDKHVLAKFVYDKLVGTDKEGANFIIHAAVDKVLRSGKDTVIYLKDGDENSTCVKLSSRLSSFIAAGDQLALSDDSIKWTPSPDRKLQDIPVD